MRGHQSLHGWSDLAWGIATVASGPLAPVVGGAWAYNKWKESQAPQVSEPTPPEAPYVPVAPPPPPATVVAPAFVAPAAPPQPQPQQKAEIVAGIPNGALAMGLAAIGLVAYAIYSKPQS